MKKAQILLATALIGCVVSAKATTLTMDEVATQPISGLSVSGVTFGFTVSGLPSLDATYNISGPGTTTYIQDPSIEGSVFGLLQLNFSAPVTNLSFGVALNHFGSLAPGFSVHLFDTGLTSLGVFDVDTAPLVSYSEGQFAYAGASVARAEISFANEAFRFAFDNLSFSSSNVPEPATVALVGLSGLGLFLFRRRKAEVSTR